MGHSSTHASLHERFNARDFDAVEAECAPGFMFEDLARSLTIKTPTEFTDYLRAWVSSFSDGSVGSPTYVEGADFSVARYHGRGHFDGILGEFRGTGRFLDLPMCEVLHYASDGKVLSGELYYDQVTMMGQLGLMPAGMDEAPLESPAAVVRAMIRDFDRMDIAAMRSRFTADVRGIDEISRGWIREQSAMEEYFRGLEGQVTDIATTLFDLDEVNWGDTALVTGWLEQDYKIAGQPVHVSSPLTVLLRREGDSWKTALVHAIPLPEEDG